MTVSIMIRQRTTAASQNFATHEEVRESVQWRALFKSHHEARRNCEVTTRRFMDFLVKCFREWYVADHGGSLKLPIELGDLTVAYETTRMVGLHPDLRRYSVDLYLQSFLKPTRRSELYEQHPANPSQKLF